MRKMGFIAAALGVVAAIAVAVAVTKLRPGGEEGDIRRLEGLLGSADAVLQGGGHSAFPDMADSEVATQQVEAIRRFATTYPQSPYVDRILEAHLLPNLAIDVEGNGLLIAGGADTQWMSLLAWEIHQLAPERRPTFAADLEKRMGEVPKSGFALEKLAEALGDKAMAARAWMRRVSDDSETLLERRRSVLAAAPAPGAGAVMHGMLKEAKSAGDVLVVDVRGHEPNKGVHDELRGALNWRLAYHAGLGCASPDAVDPNARVIGRLVVRLSDEVRRLPVVVNYQPSLVTTTSQRLRPTWVHGVQRFDFRWVETKTTTAEGGGAEGEQYPILSAKVSLGPAEGKAAWSDEMTSDWLWTDPGGGGERRGEALVEGAEVPSSDFRYSVENLADRVAHALLGEAFR